MRDHKVVERDHVAFRSFLSLDPPHQPCGLIGYRMGRNQRHEFFDIVSAPLAFLGCSGAIDACTHSATVTGESDKSSDPCTTRIASMNAETDCFFLSALMMVLESRTNPKRADSMAAGDF